MKNEFKLPRDVKYSVCWIVAGQFRRTDEARRGLSNENEQFIIENVNSALEEVCEDIKNIPLKNAVKNALVLNCESKNNVYEHFYLPGISRKNFYYRKRKLLYIIAEKNNQI